MARNRPWLLGIDLGASTLKLAVCTADGAILRRASSADHEPPVETLARVLADLGHDGDLEGDVKVAVTGQGHACAALPPCLVVNEVVATARGAQQCHPSARTVVDLGGQFSKWIALGRDSAQPGSVVDFASNGLCAAGAGAFLEQQASRLGLTVAALGCLAANAPRGASIAGRCSVFAKSDMIHLQQKGTPVDEIAYGLCLALARTFLATVVGGRKLVPPVVLAGGGACNPGLVRAFRELLSFTERDVFPAREPMFLGALGAASMAAGASATSWRVLTQHVALAERGGGQRPPAPSCGSQPLRGLPPLGSPGMLPDPRAREAPSVPGGHVAAYLGLDVGSVSTNLALIDRDLGLLQGVYLPTRGRPVEVIQEGLDVIRRQFGDRLEVLGVGTTGSGRHLAARLIGADVVHNEITAQMVSALFHVPDVDTIFEIGGQDSKYIAVRDGRLADFEMNKICAGGTGSFLEEQAEHLGIDIIDEFSALALESACPCDLGVRCTVFMDAELVRAQQRGVPLADLCAGLAYSVARNYLEKVVGGRAIGRSIVFQGGTASNAAVVQAFRRLLDRDILVHPCNRISGAIGAALLAARAATGRTRFEGFAACASPAVRSFTCRQCENRCQVNRIRIAERVVHVGDVCERYSTRDHEREPDQRPFAELFASRERLTGQFTGPPQAGDAPKKRIGLLRASLNLEFLPLWVTFLRELGFEPIVSDRTTPELVQEHARGVPAEICLPIKVAAAHARVLLAHEGVNRLFVPALLEVPPREETDRSHTCLYGQQLADVLRVELGDRVISAQFSLGRGLLWLVGPTLSLAEVLDCSAEAVLRALRKANAVHALYIEERRQMGRRALEARFDRAVVVLGRPYNTHDAFLNLSLARHLDRLGLAAIPWDLLSLDEVRLDARWNTVPWHYSRELLRAIEVVRGDSRLFPILVSSYGCGPDGFLVKHLEELLRDRPRLLLEFDEHRGEAGLVTRLEAFADEIDEHLRRRTAPVPDAAARQVTPGPRTQPAGRRFFLPHFSEHAGIYAAVLRTAGYEAEVLPLPDAETVERGQHLASGRECHPYTVLAGELARFAGSRATRPGDVFFFPNCTTPCLLNQYGDGYRIALDRLASTNVEVWEATTSQLKPLVGVAGMIRLYEGLLATDVLMVLGSRLHPYQQSHAAFDAAYHRALRRLAAEVESASALDETLASLAGELWNLPRAGAPASRPVVGVTGDIYTRMNSVGNADLFERLERMGVEVWPGPCFATMSDLASTIDLTRSAEKGLIKAVALGYLGGALTARSTRRFVQHLPPAMVELVVEPTAAELLHLARPYVGPRTSHLIVLIAAKMADFLRRGATGVISAVGLNCMVGTATAALVPAVRADYGEAPVITLTYGGPEAPSQRIRLETFVEQVHARWRPRAA